MLTVLWDNDGVLVDTEGAYYQACRDVLAGVDVELTLEQFQDISLRQGQSVFVLAEQRGLGAEPIARLRQQRDRLHRELLLERSPVIDGVRDVLSALHGQVRMGVVTSASREHFEAAHASGQLLAHMDFVLTREDYALSKPHPEPYLTALERYNLLAEQCVVIEDSERGLAAATAAGLACIIVLSKWTSDGEFNQAVAVVENIADAEAEIRKRMPAT